MNYVTCVIKIPEGIGSLLQYILSCYFLAKLNGLKFVYTPIDNIEHMSWDGYSSQKEWYDMWNNYIINIFLPKDDIILLDDLENVNKVVNSLDFQNHENTLFILDAKLFLTKYYLDAYFNQFSDVINNLTNNYILKNNISSYFNKSKINIAVHIRRYTNTDCDNSEFRELYIKGGHSDVYFYSLMSNLIELLKCKEKQIEFHIFTQLCKDEDNTIFDHYFNLKNENVEIILHKGNEDTMKDLHHMITSDILLMSKSAFSSIANFYSTGISIIRCSFMHILKNNTIFVDSNGNFLDEQKEYILNNL
jgi:hypothetical protein